MWGGGGDPREKKASSRVAGRCVWGGGGDLREKKASSRVAGPSPDEGKTETRRESLPCHRTLKQRYPRAIYHG